LRVVAISGKKQSGKDTLCDLLQPKLDKLGVGRWSRIAFADGVKDVLCRVLGVNREFVEEWKTKDEVPPGWEMTVREAMINIGDRFREIKPTIWMDLVFRRRGNKLISDVRYKNEAALCREQGQLIRIHRPGLGTLDNPSETDLLEYDKVCLDAEIDGPVNLPGIPYTGFIVNDTSIEDLEEKLETRLMSGITDSVKFFTK